MYGLGFRVSGLEFRVFRILGGFRLSGFTVSGSRVELTP